MVENGISVEVVNKVVQGRPHIVDAIKNREISFIVNTVGDEKNAVTDSLSIRTSALAAKVTTYTTIAGAKAAVEGMTAIAQSRLEVYDLKHTHKKIKIMF